MSEVGSRGLRSSLAIIPLSVVLSVVRSRCYGSLPIFYLFTGISLSWRWGGSTGLFMWWFLISTPLSRLSKGHLLALGMVRSVTRHLSPRLYPLFFLELHFSSRKVRIILGGPGMGRRVECCVRHHVVVADVVIPLLPLITTAHHHLVGVMSDVMLLYIGEVHPM